MPTLDALLERFRGGDRLALARLLSLVARGERLEEIRRALAPGPGSSLVVAVTGSTGVGKSTLVGKLIGAIRRLDKSVAVLACDPQSPVSGGALLGDRFRMPALPEDDRVFIRSLATSSGQGGLAGHLALMIQLLESFGFEIVLIETVGAGQGDTEAHAVADVVLLLLQPESGDDLQWEKAGILEVADILAIHKADLPGAERVEAQVRAATGLTANSTVPVLRVGAKTGEGIEELWKAITASGRRRAQPKQERELLRLAQDQLASWYARAEAASDPRLSQLIAEWRQGKISSQEAGKVLWHQLELQYGSE